MNVKDFCLNPICGHCLCFGAPPRCDKSLLDENERYELVKNMKKCPDKKRCEFKLNQKKDYLKQLGI